MRQILNKLAAGNSRGLGLVEILVATAILSGSIVMGTQLTRQVSFLKTTARAKSGALLVRNKILTAVNSPAGWNKTISMTNENPGLACLSAPTGTGNCYGMTGIAFSAYEISGSQITNANNASDGYDIDGKLCNGFDAVNGNDNCPFRYNLTWRAICRTPTCPAPQVEITGTFLFKPKTWTVSLNTTNFNLKFIRADSENNVYSAVCASMGGTFDLATKQCILPFVGKCPAGMVVVGIDPSTNSKRCGLSWVSPMCPAGSVFKGTQPDGKVYCVPLNCGFGSGWTPPTGWIPGPPGIDFGADGGDGGCDGADGGCGS